MIINISIELECSRECDAEDIASALQDELTGYTFEVEDVWDFHGDTERVPGKRFVVVNSLSLIRGSTG